MSFPDDIFQLRRRDRLIGVLLTYHLAPLVHPLFLNDKWKKYWNYLNYGCGFECWLPLCYSPHRFSCYACCTNLWNLFISLANWLIIMKVLLFNSLFHGF